LYRIRNGPSVCPMYFLSHSVQVNWYIPLLFYRLLRLSFCDRKKEHLNKELYTLQLQEASEWGTLWDSISETIHQTTQNMMDNKYNTIDRKPKRLTQNRGKNRYTDTHVLPPRLEQDKYITGRRRRKRTPQRPKVQPALKT
jgi:hypothetical protein